MSDSDSDDDFMSADDGSGDDAVDDVDEGSTIPAAMGSTIPV